MIIIGNFDKAVKVASLLITSSAFIHGLQELNIMHDKCRNDQIFLSPGTCSYLVNDYYSFHLFIFSFLVWKHLHFLVLPHCVGNDCHITVK